MRVFFLLSLVLFSSAFNLDVSVHQTVVEGPWEQSDGLRCPSKDYYCCTEMKTTWAVRSPREDPKRVRSPKACYKKKQWACCVPAVRSPLRYTVFVVESLPTSTGG